MLTYIIRRLLLMPITLFGITVMVFLIARFAPGSPARMPPDAMLDAETREALREQIERKYGLNLPLHEQYIRWWRNMFTLDVQATAWYDAGEGGELQPVYTVRRPPREYYARLPDGQWVMARAPDFADEYVVATAPEFAARIIEPELEQGAPPPVVDRSEEAEEWEIAPIEFAAPIHVFGEAELIPIDSLDDDVTAERLVRATDLARFTIPIEAPAWAREGEPLYINPADPERPIGVDQSGNWFVLTTDVPLARSRIYPIRDDATLEPILGRIYSRFPAEEDFADRYAEPHVAIVYGSRERIDEPPAPVEELERLTLPFTVAAPVTMWVKAPDSEKYIMLWQPEAAPSPVLVRNDDGSWSRVIGASRVAPLDQTIYEQDDAAFLARLSAEAKEELPEIEDLPRTPRHAALSGELTPYASAELSPREIRRYSHATEIFEITFGRSQQNNATVIEEMKRRLPVTLLISLIAFPITYMIAIPVGMLMAVKRGKYFDTGSNVTMLALWSVPVVLSATLAIGYLTVGGKGFELFPNNGLSSVGADSMPFVGFTNENGVYVRGWLEDRIWHLILPVLCIVYGGFAYLAKQMRAAMLDNFTMDYVRTARAKGVPFKDIVFQHVLRNSLLPLITIFATILPALIAGSVFIEKIFNIEGMGLLLFRAVQNRDYDVVQALALIVGVLNLTGLLLADICYAIADPRITHR